MSEKSLEGKVALITGSSKGLGKALAIAFAERGAKVAVNSRSEGSAHPIVDELKSMGAEAISATGNIADPDDARGIVDAVVDAFGKVDVLVNNAGVLGSRVPLEDYPDDEWANVMKANVNGIFLVSKYAIPHMGEGGSIINLVSGASVAPRADWGAYSVSKFAVEGLTGNLALELEERGIRVNAVDPGGMRTDMRASAYPDEDPQTKLTPEENTAVFLYLASDESRGVTGERFKAQEFAG